jgi:hypothetical protein
MSREEVEGVDDVLREAGSSSFEEVTLECR